MARNDGIDRTVARNQDLETPADVAKVQEHNEREKDSYSNQDIVQERTSLNVHFKAPTDDYHFRRGLVSGTGKAQDQFL